jgi:hypothetical protein
VAVIPKYGLKTAAMMMKIMVTAMTITMTATTKTTKE